MKSIALALSFAAIIQTAQAQRVDEVKRVEAENAKKESEKIVDKRAADFLVESADARMMDFKEGKLAAEKGTTQQIRDYGKLMMKDQPVLLEKIRVLAANHSISLPNAISNKKEEGREELSGKSGKEFDEKFLKMITIDHERDVKLFRKAADLKEGDVRDFASSYLPMIQSHLDKANKIKDAK